MHIRIYACLLLPAACFDAAASDLYTEIKRLRAGEGPCAVVDELPPLKPQPALARVARALSLGDKLQPSLNAAGYRVTDSSAFSISGDGVGAQAAVLLAGI